MQADRVLALSLGSLFLGSPIRAQMTQENPVEAHFPDGSARQMTLIPSAANVLFPNSKVILDMRDTRIHLEGVNGTPLEKLQFVTVRNYVSKQTAEAIPSARKHNAPVRAARITAVVYENKIYAANRLFWGENTAVINALLRTLDANVDSPEIALQLTKFFLQLGYYGFDDPDNFVVSKFTDLGPKQIEFPGQSVKEMQSAVQPPVAKQHGNVYKVDLVTQDKDAAFVVLHRWRITIIDSQITDAREEVLLRERDHFRVGEAASNSMSGTLASPASNLRFQLSIMADGKTTDSKHLNVSTYTFTTSDGPPVRRSAYFFKSEQRAVRELHNQLSRASQILGQGHWTDDQGKMLGERALVLYSNRGSGDLVAAVLLRRDTRFFQIWSSCLRNVLEFEKVWFHSDLNSK